MKPKLFLLIAGLLIFGIVMYLITKPGKITKDPENTQSHEISKNKVMDSLPKASRRYTIGVLFPMLAAPFWINESYGVFDQAKLIGVDVVWYSADGYTNVDKQNSQIEDLITQKVDAILIAPTSLTGNTPAIEKAINNGIKVIIHVTGTSASGVSGAVLADDLEIGRTQAEYISKALNGKGKVLMLTGPSGADWAMNRQKAFKQYFAENARGVQIVAERSGEPERVASQKISEELLIKFGDVDAIYTAADGMAIGVAQTLENIQVKKKIILTTASFSKESVPYIQSGAISVNVDESPMLQGRTALNAAVYVLEGYKIPETIMVPVPGIDKGTLEKIDLKKRWAPDGYSPAN